MPAFVSDKRLCLDETRTRVVDCDSEEAAFVLVGEGGTVSTEDAAKYDLTPPPAPTAVDQDAADSNAGPRTIERPGAVEGKATEAGGLQFNAGDDQKPAEGDQASAEGSDESGRRRGR